MEVEVEDGDAVGGGVDDVVFYCWDRVGRRGVVDGGLWGFG